MLVDGRSGAGKSTLLRTLAGLWPFAKGSFSLPDKKFLFVTQKAYLPFDALEDVLTYPVRGRFTESELKDALEQVGLGRLSARRRKTGLRSSRAENLRDLPLRACSSIDSKYSFSMKQPISLTMLQQCS